MQRRRLLQGFSATLLSPLPGLAAVNSKGRLPPWSSGAEPDKQASHCALGDVKANDWLMTLSSCCIGLGSAAAALMQAIQARTDMTQVELMAHHAPAPQMLTDWLRNQPAPADYLVLLVDPSDPLAVVDLAAQVSNWRPPQCAYCIALLLNDPLTTPAAPQETHWRAALNEHFDAVVDLAPRSSAYQRLAAQILIDGTLLFSTASVGYDPGDVRTVLRLDRSHQTAATTWSRLDQRDAALQRLSSRYRSSRSKGLLGFVHAGPGFTIQDYDSLGEQLPARLALPELEMMVLSVFVHDDWPAQRCVLGVTL